MNRKILILPSWYPTPRFPLRGSFFQEQALYLEENLDLDILVLFGERKSFPLLGWIRVFLEAWTKSFWPIAKEKVQQNPLAFGYSIPANRRVPDGLQIRLEKLLLWKAYQNLIRSGWVPDLIHAQSGMDAGIYAHHISKLTNIPFVILEHQVFVFHYYSRSRGTQILDAFKAAQKTGAVSHDERRQVMMNQPECNPEVIWNLVDEDRYRIEITKRNNSFTVITILNSLPIKGAVEFLEAMAIVILREPTIRFIMVGKGGDKNSSLPEENLFVKKSKELRIFEKGEFLPFVARERISDVLNQAHVFVSPTLQEPHGIAVREAMMCGLPIISTANGGVEDSINPETGLIVPVRDAQAMAKSILQIRENYPSYKPEAIRELAIKQCGREAFLQSMSSFYQL